LDPSLSIPSIEEKLAHLKNRIASLGNLIVGFSGGVDSAFLTKVAYDVLGERAVALTAISASLPQSERSEAARIASAIGVRHEMIASDEIHNPKYAANPINRCFFCKQALFVIADALKEQLGFEHVAIGTNLDDLGDHRPGLVAAERYGALSPLVEAGFTKSDVREGARRVGLDAWNKPAYACLSSRFPYGTPITEERLDRVGRCEEVLKSLGFSVFRVRFHDDVARIEIGADEYERLYDAELRDALNRGVKEAGFKFVSVDLEPYRSGRLNE